MLTPEQEAASTQTSPERLINLLQNSPELALIVANNENAPAELLRELAASEDEQIRQAISSNPNTPTDILFELGEEFSQELLDNPVFSLLFLENPNLLQDIPHGTLTNLFKLPSIPDTFLQWGLNCKQTAIYHSLVMNPKVSKEDLYKLTKKVGRPWGSGQIPKVAKLHVNWSGQMESGWKEAVLSVLQKRELHKDRIEHDLFSEIILWQIGVIPESLVTSLDFHTLKQIASNPDTPEHILQTLLKNRKTAIKKIRIAIASNLNTPLHILEKLVGDENSSVRQAASLNPSTPSYILQRFLHYQTLVQNPHTPSDKLTEIINVINRDWIDICLALASHPNASREILEKLALDKSWKIIATVAGNVNTPIHVLEKLVKNKSSVVRHAVARNPNTSVKLLDKLYRDKDNWIRKYVAQHPNVTPEILANLADEKDYYVHIEIAKNQKTPADGIKKLVNTKSREARYFLTINPNTPSCVLEKLAEISESDIRRNVASHSKTAISTLTKLASDTIIEVRLAVAQNPNTSEDILAVLKADNNELVRLAVTARQEKKQSENLADIHIKESSQNNPVSVEDETDLLSDDLLSPDFSIEALSEILETEKYEIPLEVINNLCQKMTLNLDIPDSILNRCALIDNIDLKIALARYPKTSELIFEQLIKRRSSRLHRLLPENPNLPKKLLIKLLQNNNYEVRQAAFTALQKNHLTHEDDSLNKLWQQWNMAKNADTPDEILVELAQSKWVLIREAVASHPKVALIVYQKDKQANQSNNANENSNPTTLLEKLIADKNQAVRIAIANNPQTPLDILEDLASSTRYENPVHVASVKNLLQRLPEHASLYFEDYVSGYTDCSLSRFFVLLHPLTRGKIFAKHFRSSSWLERYAVATNPNTPAHIREYLSEDANRIVRAGAKTYL